MMVWEPSFAGILVWQDGAVSSCETRDFTFRSSRGSP
jgi:hypothetical protein